MNITNLKISNLQFVFLLALSIPIGNYLYSAKSNLIKIEYQITAGFVYPQLTCTGHVPDKLYFIDTEALNTNKNIIQDLLNDEVLDYKIKLHRNAHHALYKYEIIADKSNYSLVLKYIENTNNIIANLEKSSMVEVFENIKIKCENINERKLYLSNLTKKDIHVTQKSRHSKTALFFIMISPSLLLYFFLIIYNYLRKNNLLNKER